jgi:hypothetical protein
VLQNILNDPTMQKVLKDLQENPAAGQAYVTPSSAHSSVRLIAHSSILSVVLRRAMRDKDIRANIEKLIAAGVLSVG